MNSRDELFKLMQENPELPIVFACSSDELEDFYLTFYRDFSCDIVDIYETEEQIFDHIIDITEYYQDLYSDDEELTKEEWDKKIQNLVDETPHYKAIRIFCR